MDRPGYGASDPEANTSFINWVNDLIQLVDHLNIQTFSLTGYAMGSVYALACAYKIPERITRVAIISGGMPIKTMSDLTSVTPLVKMNYRMAKYIPKVYKLFNTIQVKGILSNRDSFIKQFSEKMDQADRKIMNSESFKIQMFDSLREGFRQGGKSMSRDFIQLMQDWSFDPTEIKVPIDIWHGTSDFHIPMVVSKRLSEHVKNSKLFLKERQGHYMFYTHWSEIMDELLKQD